MATRTQKAKAAAAAADAGFKTKDTKKSALRSKETKAAKPGMEPAAKPAKAKPSAKPAAKSAAKPAPKEAARPTKLAKGKPRTKANAPVAPTEADASPPLPEPKRTSFSERFWHRLGLRAQKKEAQAHQHEAEIEAAEARAEAERLQQEREQRKAQSAAERRKTAAATRELKRIAEEEARNLKQEEARKAKEAKMTRAERSRSARQAKADAQEAARIEAERAEQERLQREQHDREVEAAAAEAEAALAAAKAKRQQKRQLVEETVVEEADESEPEAEPEPEPEAEPVVAAKPMVSIRSRAPQPAEAEDEAEDEEPEEVEVPAPKREPTKPAPPTSELESQADKVAAELMARRSKPVTIDIEDEEPVPTLPVGRKSRPEQPTEVLQLDPAPPARIPEMAAPRGLSIPEHFILLALDEGWDERTEKAAAGHLGGGLTGALLLELVLHGKVKVQRDRFQLTDAAVDDAASAVVVKLRQIGDRPSLQAMGELAKWLPQLLPAYKDRMASRGLIAHKSWRHMGVFYRSQTVLVDADAQERMRNKLARAIAGGGRPDAPTILSLGLLEASGLFGVVVPEGAQAYNRKRLNGLLGGKDVMGYKVDDELKGTQEMAVRTILDNVRMMTTRG